MKKFIFSFLVAIFVSSAQLQAFDIVPYVPVYKDAVIRIIFQDPQLFFCDREFAHAVVPAKIVEQLSHDSVERYFTDPAYVRLVALEGEAVVGFVCFYQAREQSLEDAKAMLVASGESFPDDAQLMAFATWLKPAAACRDYVELEALAVDRNHRRLGIGHALLHAALAESVRRWPSIKLVTLKVNPRNKGARALYESEGFMFGPTSRQRQAAMIGAVQYEKVL